MAGKTLKEIYGYSYIEKPEYDLQLWFNRMLDKTEGELAQADVTRDMMQRMFLDTTLPLALAYLKADVFTGEYYKGNLLELVSKFDKEQLQPYKKKVQEIVKSARDEANKHNWEFESDTKEFKNNINVLEEKIKEKEN